jgi:hypothetical protein
MDLTIINNINMATMEYCEERCNVLDKYGVSYKIYSNVIEIPIDDFGRIFQEEITEIMDTILDTTNNYVSTIDNMITQICKYSTVNILRCYVDKLSTEETVLKYSLDTCLRFIAERNDDNVEMIECVMKKYNIFILDEIDIFRVLNKSICNENKRIFQYLYQKIYDWDVLFPAKYHKYLCENEYFDGIAYLIEIRLMTEMDIVKCFSSYGGISSKIIDILAQNIDCGKLIFNENQKKTLYSLLDGDNKLGFYHTIFPEKE